VVNQLSDEKSSGLFIAFIEAAKQVGDKSGTEKSYGNRKGDVHDIGKKYSVGSTGL
jgi:cobalamin-dependent methionine synthase I